jgi:hypothetical protein
LEDIYFVPITEGFRDLQRTVLRRNLSTNLPDSLVQTRTTSSKTTKKDNTDDSNKKENKYDKPRITNNKDNPSDPIINPKSNPSWQIPQGRSFKDIFITSKMIDETPKYRETPFCLQFHTRGRCSRGPSCRLIHDDPRDVRLDRNFHSFITKAFSNPSTTPSPPSSDK